MHINDFEVVCPLCSGFFSSPSCRLYNHPCPLKKDAAQREELALRLAEQRPLVIPLAPKVAQGPGPIEAAVARRVYSTHNVSCKMEVATTAACILTLVGGRDGWDRLLKAPQIDAGEACSVCGHRVVIVGYRYQICQQQQSGLDPRVTLCGPCGTWQLLWHRQAQAGAAAAAAEAAAAEGLAAAAAAEGVEAAESLAAAAAVAEGAATAVGVAAAQRHRGLALRSLVAQAQPGVSPVPVCALNLYQKPLVAEVLREATLPGQQARVTPLHAEKPTCVQLQAFMEGRGIADIHPAPLWSAVKGKRTAAQRDGVGADGDGASAAGGPPVHDLETELKLFSAVTASERQKVTALLAAGERPTELMLEPDQTYHVLHTIPRSATASQDSIMLRQHRQLASPSELLSAPDVQLRMMNASIIIVGTRAFVPPTPAAAAAAKAAKAAQAGHSRPRLGRTSATAAATVAAEATAAAAATVAADATASSRTATWQPRQPASPADHAPLLSPLKGGVSPMHLDPIRAFNMALAPSCLGGEAANTVLARWVFVSPAALGTVLQLVYDLLQTAETASGVTRFVHLFHIQATGQNRPYFTNEGVAWLIEQGGLVVGRDILVLDQRHGDVVTVPPGWAHQVTNLKTCIKLAFDHHDLLEVAAHYELLHLVRQTDAGLQADAAVTATAMLLADTPQVEQTMLDALRTLEHD